ncbi:MAG: T9SS C-terminal target domain-containing protein [Haliscomenobacteraceae bacterium CHB4]|nr:hypothetical protein [Saprospiraceae bacterium]MCE7924115.1 T9SS C-terminal target domain-containing protein [Haliscomenobacteraceae bacterium CHB4]
MRQFNTFFFAFGLYFNIVAQNVSPNHWAPVALDAVALPPGAERLFEPREYSAFTLDYDAMVARLAQAPVEFTDEAAQKSCTVQIPQADGSLETFAVAYTQVMAPGLAARYPEIRTYSAESLTTPSKRARITTGPYHGLHIMITRPDKGVEWVEPLAKGQNLYYMAYDRRHYPNEIEPTGKTLAGERAPDVLDVRPDTRYSPGAPTPQDRGNLLNPVVLKVYKFACATTGEFAQDNGGTTASVLQKVTTTTNALNAIYERDLAIRLQLIEEEDQILYLDPATDPYTGTTVGGWLNQNPVAMLMQLGNNDKYDIGHVFARYLGGNAIGVGDLNSCCTDFKGRGCSAGNIPYGNSFFSVVGQEIGHQWNGLHTWNHCSDLTEPFPNYERCEPGSGSTIMSYAGSCGDDNVQGSADLYYHVCSIFGIRNFVENGNGKLCGQNITTGNNPPVPEIPYPDNFFIPIETPFELTGSATDPDGDAVTFNWDEVDLGPLVAMSAPQGNSPIFRSFPPSSNPTRTFPRIQSIVFNTGDDSEKLPTYSRDLTFCLVARDDKPGGGGVGFDTIAFRATAQAGPFLVTYPNANTVVWNVGEYQTITWDVANTNKAPVNCKTVNIRLSLNNGLVNQITLASGVPNTGKYCIQVPNNISSTARIRVEAADNVFFDISNAGFKIQQPTQPDFTICPAVLADYACAPTVYTTEISTSAIAGFSDMITLEATGLPAGATATFSPNPVAAGSPSTLTVDFSGATDEGPFDLTVSATANGNTKTSVLTFNVVQNDFSALALESPADGAQSVDIAPWLRWNAVADADFYEVQVATSPSFDAGSILATNTGVVIDSFKVPVLLAEGQVCYWRVRPRNDCGNGAWTEPFVFVTKVQNCTQLAATDLPINITSNGTPTIESVINVPGSGATLSDVNVKKVQGTHAFMSDIEVTLISPANTTVQLFKNKCSGYGGNFNIGFDDSAPASFSCPPPQNGSVAKPAQALSALNGQGSGGVWKLRVKDNTIGSGGQLSGFELEFCSSVALNAPFIVNNNTLQVMPGTNAVIDNNLLKVDDPNNMAGQLIFTLITVPESGDLRIDGVPLQPGAQFSQDDINNGLLRYYEYGFNTGTDQFRFSVTDGEGGLVSGTFDILPFPLNTQTPSGDLAFDLAPNPASESVRLFVSQPLDSDSRVHLFNVAGQMLDSWTLSSGATMIELDVAGLPEGMYTVSVENEKGRGVRKLVVR